jgi:glycosyltransferase involved in cell wall biosynthesis
MISVLIECLDEEHALAQTLAALVPGAVEGLVSDVIVIDRGSRDGSVKVADSAGCTVVKPAEAGEALSQARGRWLLVLEPGARPLAGWIEALSGHVADGGERAARFRLAPSVPVWQRFSDRVVSKSLQGGVLLRRDKAIRAVESGEPVDGRLPRLIASVAGRMVRLDCRLMPAPRRRASGARPAGA